MLLPTFGSDKNLYDNILVKMRDDSITHAVNTDQLILSLGTRLYDKNEQHVHQHQYITQRQRELGRLLIQMRENSALLNSTLATCILPCNWNALIDAVKLISGYDEKSHKYRIPSLPMKLGHSLSKCAKLVKTPAIHNTDENGKKNAEDFLELYACEGAERVSSQALTTLHENKFNTPKYLPVAEDVKLLNSHQESKSESLKQSIVTNLDHYSELVEVCLAQLILFNRKRSGETERIEVQYFKAGILEKDIPTDTDVLNSLSKFERELCRSHKRIEIRGKRGRKVSVLFTESIKNNIEALLKARKKLKFSSRYLFVKPNSQYPVRGCDCLRKFSKECGAKYPELLTSTRLRKHLATMTQVLGLSESNQDVLAQFIGHDIRIHRQFYRLPENMLELAKVSKVLHLINTGNISTFSGKDFDEIDFNQTDEIEDIGNNLEASEDEDENEVDGGDDREMPDKAQNCSKTNVDTDPVRKQRRQLIKARTWSEQEQAAVLRHLGDFLKNRRLPGKLHCEQTKKPEKVLALRTWQQIKHFIRNKITATTKNVKFTV